MTSEDQKILTMTAACPEWLGEKLSIPLKDQTGNIIGGVDFGAGESWGVVRVTESAAVTSLAQAFDEEGSRYLSMGYRVIEVDSERIAFEDWYTCNAFDLEANPIGSRDCCMMWKAWKARANIANDPNP
jgi:hypothetical protein